MTESADAPEWTDFNEADPGISVLQLFTYVGEMLLGVALVVACWRCVQRARATAGRLP